MSTVIKGGTIVTADMTYKADVLIEGDKIAADRQGPQGRQGARRHGLLRHAGRHRPAHPSRNALHGHLRPTDDFSSPAPARRSRAARRWSSTSACPRPTSRCSRRCRMWDQQGRQGGVRLFLPHGDHLVGRAGVEGDGRGGRARHQHLQALHGLQGRADGERRRDVRSRSCAAPSSARCRWSMPRTATSSRALQQKYMAAGNNGPGGPRLFAAARGRGRGDQPRHHDRRRGRRAALCRARLLRAGARGDPPGAGARACASMASR